MNRPLQIALLVVLAVALAAVGVWATHAGQTPPAPAAAGPTGGTASGAPIALAAADDEAPSGPPAPAELERPADPLACGPILPEQQRGMSYAHAWRGGGYGSDDSSRALAEMASVGVDWISLIPFGYMPSISATEVQFRPTGNRGETDDRLRAATEQARALGMRVLMKPHLWLHTDGWRGEITFDTEAGWDAWFASYERFILHYARLSEELGMPMLAVGVELRSTTASHPDHWRRLIAAVREVYTGELVYAANWDSVEQVPFWDAVDYVGVQMFAPLAASADASRAELVRAAERHLEAYEAVARRVDRPLLLTEVGFRAVEDTAVRPWEWPRRGDGPSTTGGDLAQVDAYCAIVETFGRSEHVAGMYWWKWYSSHERQDGPRGFSPRGKPAEHVLRYAFGPGS